MIIMSVESTCDETAVALVRDGREVLTDQIFSQEIIIIQFRSQTLYTD